jgi:hypothetical protein
VYYLSTSTQDRAKSRWCASCTDTTAATAVVNYHYIYYEQESKPDNGGDLLGGGGSDGFDFDPRAGGGSSGASLTVPQVTVAFQLTLEINYVFDRCSL